MKLTKKRFFVINPIPTYTSSRNRFQTSVAFHTETSQLICSANQIIGFYMNRITKLKWIKFIALRFSESSTLEYWGH